MAAGPHQAPALGDRGPAVGLFHQVVEWPHAEYEVEALVGEEGEAASVAHVAFAEAHSGFLLTRIREGDVGRREVHERYGVAEGGVMEGIPARASA
jgi:hypothetical protein